ncbi:MAG: SctK family type III secretion system sorting platform protein [Desulfovibrionaceae bacterium]|nr:SctK family type III secretion system sorting platform protein [Desulfovibrionaceae bacterium]
MRQPTYNKAFFADILEHNKTLWPLILLYNATPKEPPKDDMRALRSWLQALPASARFIADKDLPKRNFFWDFQEETRRLALLPDNLLAQLAKIVGVTLHAKSLAQLVTRNDRQACQEALGIELFNYALVRGQYVVGGAAEIFAKRNLDLTLVERVQIHGLDALLLLANFWPDDLAQPFKKRLASSNGEPKPLSQDESTTLWRLVKKCLLREVAPTWTPYFTF